MKDRPDFSQHNVTLDMAGGIKERFITVACAEKAFLEWLEEQPTITLSGNKTELDLRYDALPEKFIARLCDIKERK